MAGEDPTRGNDLAFVARIEELPHGPGVIVQFEKDSNPLSHQEVIGGWRQDEKFRQFFFELLASSPYQAFRWETPPLRRDDVGQPFECVLLDDPSLERPANFTPFLDHFVTAATTDVLTFPNLGHDSVLVVPCPGESAASYAHLAAFSRSAPSAQQHALWRAVGEAMERRLGSAPVWLNTAGDGIAWLHVRLDDLPKYYRHEPYR